MQRMPITPVRKRLVDSTVQEDLLVTEEPLEIRLGHGPVDERQEIRLAVTMRTPGDDELLALGFLFSEGLITNMGAVLRVEHCQQVKPEEQGNVVRVELHPDIPVDEQRWQRNFYTTSSCGVCGKSSLEAVNVLCEPLPESIQEPELELLLCMPESMRAAQVVFEHTGGIHAAALFDHHGQLVMVHEDIGRHNAVDKVLGTMLKDGVDPLAHVLVVSGRAGFELVQKAAVARIPIMLSVGAPSSLAVQLADRTGITLYGFVTNGEANRYTNLN